MKAQHALIGLLVLSLLVGGCGASTTPTPPRVPLPTPTPLTVPTVVWRPSPTPTRVLTLSPPTPVAFQTPRPTPTRAYRVYAWVRPRQARLRTAPNPDAAVVTRVPAGTTVILLGRTADARWFYVRTDPVQGPAHTGWMAAEVLVLFTDPTRVPVRTPTPTP